MTRYYWFRLYLLPIREKIDRTINSLNIDSKSVSTIIHVFEYTVLSWVSLIKLYLGSWINHNLSDTLCYFTNSPCHYLIVFLRLSFDIHIYYTLASINLIQWWWSDINQVSTKHLDRLIHLSIETSIEIHVRFRVNCDYLIFHGVSRYVKQ